MSILDVVAEDFEYPVGAWPGVVTSSYTFRSGYGRCTMRAPDYNVESRSKPFIGGAVTDVWLHFRCYDASPRMANGARLIGIGSSTEQGGIYLCRDSAETTRLAICKWDGTDQTDLGSEAGLSFPLSTIVQIDLHIVYDASGSVDVYINGAADPVISFSGDTTVGAATELDTLILCNSRPNGVWDQVLDVSEVVVADEDPRTWNVSTLYPNAAGDLNEWTGTYDTIDEVTLDDADLVYVNANDKDAQFNLSNPPAGNYGVIGVVVSTRAARTSGSTPTILKLGVKTNGSVNVDGGWSVVTAWDRIARIMGENPVTGLAWTKTEIEALQINLRSAA